MKKSATIQLVLITAALASCDKVIIPGQSAGEYPSDPVLTMAPVEEDTLYDCTCQLHPDDWKSYDPYDYFYSPYVNFNMYFTGQPFNVPYKAGHQYRINTTFRNHVIIVHGGFGKAASAGSAAAAS